MKKLASALLCSFLLVALTGCFYPPLDKEVKINDNVSYHATYRWRSFEVPDDPNGIEYETESGYMVVTYSEGQTEDADQAYEAFKEKCLSSGKYSDWQDISREESTIDGATCVIHEYSYVLEGSEKETIKEAAITKDGFTLSIKLTESNSEYGPLAFDEVLKLVKFS